MKDLVRTIKSLVWLTLFAAVYQELRKPPEQRTWHGKVAGVVPYDFRVPTIKRLRESYWAPESDHVFTERVFGVGWGVNIPVALRKISQIAEQYVSASGRLRKPPED